MNSVELEVIFKKDSDENGLQEAFDKPIQAHDWKEQNLSIEELFHDSGILHQGFKWNKCTKEFKNEFLDAVLKIASSEFEKALYEYNVSIAKLIYQIFKYAWMQCDTDIKISLDDFVYLIQKIYKNLQSVRNQYDKSKWNIYLYYTEVEYRRIIRKLEEYISDGNKDKTIFFLQFMKENHLGCFIGFKNLTFNLNFDFISFFKHYANKHTEKFFHSDYVNSVFEKLK